MKTTLLILTFSFSFLAVAEELGLPEWTLKSSDGEIYEFPKYAIENEQVTVLFFLATWCPYCQQLMPHIQSALYQYKDSINLKVFALNINEDDDPKDYLHSNGYGFKLFPKAESVAEKYKIYGTPGIIIFDKKGQLVFDLREVQSKHLVKQKTSHGDKSIRLAPYWAAEIRKALHALR